MILSTRRLAAHAKVPVWRFAATASEPGFAAGDSSLVAALFGTPLAAILRRRWRNRLRTRRCERSRPGAGPGTGIRALSDAPRDGERRSSRQTAGEAAAKSEGCISCHKGQHEPHGKPETVRLGCVDCHGGDPTTADLRRAHVWPRYPEAWGTSANPVRTYTLLNHESPEFIRFVNPGDLRIAHLSCGNCHANEVLQNKKSMMTHGAMLWGAALYNNGSVPLKRARFGESYSMNGAPQRLQTVPPPTPTGKSRFKGVVAYLDPLPRFESLQPGNVLRIFERGGRRTRRKSASPTRSKTPASPAPA